MAVSQRSLESWLIACTAASLTCRPARLLLCVRTYLAECTAGRKQDCRCWTWRDCATTKIADRAGGMHILPKKKNKFIPNNPFYPSIYFLSALILHSGSQGGQEPISAVLGGKGGHAIDKSMCGGSREAIPLENSQSPAHLTYICFQPRRGGWKRRRRRRTERSQPGRLALRWHCSLFNHWVNGILQLMSTKKYPCTIVLMRIQPSAARLTFQREMSLLFTKHILTNIDLASMLLCWRFKEPHKGCGPRYSACYVCLTYTATKQDDRCNSIGWIGTVCGQFVDKQACKLECINAPRQLLTSVVVRCVKRQAVITVPSECWRRSARVSFY